MHQKTAFRSIHRFLSVLLLLGLMTFPWGGNRAVPARAYGAAGDVPSASTAEGARAQQEFVIRTGNYQVPESLLAALKAKLEAIAQASGGATEFGVGYYEEHARWAWIDLLVANGSYYREEEIGPSFLYFAIKKRDGWKVALAAHDRAYRALLETVSREGLPAEELERLEGYYRLHQMETGVGATAGGLLFPWDSSQNPWRVGSRGFHPAGFTSLGMEQGAEAIDLLPPNSAQPARALAMEGGTVTKKLECRWNTVLVVRHDGYPDPKRFLYLHIQNGTSLVGVGAILTRGQVLGELRTPVFNGYWSNGVCSTQGSGAFNCERDTNPATGSLCSSSTGRHLHLGFGTDRNIVMDTNVVANLVPGNNYNSTNQESSVVSFNDNFNGPALNSRWHWYREDPTHWSLTASPGYLRIITQPKDIYEGTNDAPLLLQSLQPSLSQDFEVQSRIIITPTANFHQGGLVIYGDDDNYVRFTYAYIEGPRFEFAKEVGGIFQPIQVPAPPGINDFHLRIAKLGMNYFAYYSQDGSNWIWIGTHRNVDISPLEVGLLAFNAVGVTSIEIPADFDYFRMSTGIRKTVLSKSRDIYDGWVLESSETSNQGGASNATAATFLLGDDTGNRQYRSILHFNTSSLPDNAVIARVILKIKSQSVIGTNPFITHGKIAVDIRNGAFSNADALQAIDFQAAASKADAGIIANNPQTGGWYVSTLKAVAYPYINRTGITQLRLRFQTDDDNDAVADFLRFYSGNASAADRPVLVIEYYVP